MNKDTVKKMAKLSEKVAKVKEKIAAAKEKIRARAEKVKKGAAIAAVCFTAAVVLSGCATSDPASRLTKAEYGDIEINITNSSSNIVAIIIGDGALASADSAGSTENITASPTNDVKPDTNIEVPVNKASGAQSVGSVLGDAVAGAVKSLVDGSSSTTNTAKNCTNCTDGTCKDCVAK